MRLKIILEQSKPEQLIPINYQYYLSSFIYSTLESADSEYSLWLHDNGYKSGNKAFKFFTFSLLNLRDWELQGTSIKIKSPRIEFTISLYTQKMAEKFVAGMFKDKTMNIFDRNTRANFKIKTIEAVPEIEFNEQMFFRAKSPIAIKQNRESANEDIYIGPDHPKFTELLKKNLEEKYVTKCIMDNMAVSTEGIEEINIIGDYKGKLIKIREGDYSETCVKGYFCTFEIVGNSEMIKLGYETGFGINNSLGFGFTEQHSHRKISKQKHKHTQDKKESEISRIENEIERLKSELETIKVNNHDIHIE